MSVLKWEIFKKIFLIYSIILFVAVPAKSVPVYHDAKEAKTVYHNEKDASENEANLYFNGQEEVKKNDPFSQVTEADIPKEGELFEGDIIMDEGLRRAVLGQENKKAAVFSSELYGTRHWKGGVIPYEIDVSLTEYIRPQIPRAIRILKYFTCINLRPKLPTDEDWVIFKNGRGCSSSVGRKGVGGQSIHYAHGCHRIGTILHEIMHAAGMIHEQSRPDRDLYLTVKYEHIKSRLLRNFMKYKFYQADTLDTPYNYNSNMHYSNHAFSKDGENTLVSKFDDSLQFGQRKMLTALDVQNINTLYPCPAKAHLADDDLLYLYDNMTADNVIKKRKDAQEQDLKKTSAS